MNDDILRALRDIGLRASDEAIRALITHATKTKQSPAQVIEQLARLEAREREARNLQRRTRAASLGHVKPIDQFDWNHPRQIDRPLFDHLHDSLGFISKGENILFRGQAGVGKTTLAQYLGLKALAEGYTVRFCTLTTALADLMRQESIPALERRFKRYTTPDLLILDELGYLPCDSRAADMLFHVISRRHEKRSVIISTNLAYKKWGTVFQDAPCLSALVDRFAQHCHVIDIDADSWRDLERQQRTKRASTTKPSAARKKKGTAPTKSRKSKRT